VRWLLRNKMGYSIRYMHGHNWDCFTSGSVRFHPEMFTLRDGNRIRPLGGNAWLCTSNPETVRYMGLPTGRLFPSSAHPVHGLDQSDGWSRGVVPMRTMHRARRETANGEVLHTSGMITFYNQVTEFVAERFRTRRWAVTSTWITATAGRSQFPFPSQFSSGFCAAVLLRADGVPEGSSRAVSRRSRWLAEIVQDKMCF